MIGSMQVTGAGAPNRLRENQYEDEEEESHDFEEYDVSHSAERLKESADASCQASRGAPRSAP